MADRIVEAPINDWLGEVEGLQVSLTAGRAKLAALNRTDLDTTPGELPTSECPPSRRPGNSQQPAINHAAGAPIAGKARGAWSATRDRR